jgi:hypothetical protein
MRILSRILATATLAASAAMPFAAAAQDGNAQSWLNAFLADFAEGDVEAMVAAHAENAIFLTPQGALVGHDQIRMAIEGVLAEFGEPGAVFEVSYMIAEGNVAQLVWTGESAVGVYEFAAETYVFEDGKIVYHTFAALLTPKP